MITKINLDLIRPVRLMPEQVSRKIAAGEVIERPASVLRELLDNSIDAQSKTINISLEEGGNTLIEVIDDGCGMTKEDLGLAYLNHASSKIYDEVEMMGIKTLGFRGEALSAIGSVARLEISSGRNGLTHELKVEDGKQTSLKVSESFSGTRVRVFDLFYNYPARKQFLKRSSTEWLMCLQTILDKASSNYHIEFRIKNDNELKLFIPRHDSLKERIYYLYKKELADKKFVHSISGTEGEIEFEIIASSIDLYRHDRKFIHTYINGRRIYDFGLVQSAEYGYQGLLPGGRFPCVFTFLRVPPETVDVNIHPAKREVKLRDYAIIHHRIVELISSFLRYQQKPNIVHDKVIKSENYTIPIVKPFSFEENPPLIIEDLRQPIVDFKYLGMAFKTFLIFEKSEKVFLLDMHAAHERILYDKFFLNPQKQNLLIPISVDLNDLSRTWLEREKTGFEELGFEFNMLRSSTEIRAMPSWLVDKEDILYSFLQAPHGGAHEAFNAIAAQVACRAAVKRGDAIDDLQAQNIIKAALELKEPRCPHGRPIWKIIEEEELMIFIGRHV